MRGFLGGVSVGALVAVTGAAVWSLSTPLPPVVGVAGEVPDLVLTPRQETSAPEGTPRNDADLVETAPTGPTGPTPEGIEDQGTLENISTESAGQPEATMNVSGADGDESPSSTPEISADTTAPFVTAESAPLPEPGLDETPEIPTPPAAPEAGTTAEPSLPEPEAGSDAPASQPAASDAEDIARAKVPTTLIPEGFEAPEATLPPNITAPATPPEVQSDEAETPDQTAEDKELRIADLPQTGADTDKAGPQIGTRVVPLTERDDASVQQAGDQPTPFERNSEPMEVTPGLPLMSIILIEEEGAVGADALAEFPYPLTFAVDPSDPMAAKRMAERRANGFEVMVLADLPRDAEPQDAETALPIWFDRLPETIGLLEGVNSGVQGNRALADQVSGIAGDLGYGLVLQDNGLNTVQKMALRDGVPAGVVFRDFDGAGQDPRAMRRFLDQAAFRAGQEGAVIMLGRLKPDTISALLIWGLQDRAERVTLVPVSASLKRLQDPVAE